MRTDEHVKMPSCLTLVNVSTWHISKSFIIVLSVTRRLILNGTPSGRYLYAFVFGIYSVNIACTRKTTTTVTLPCAYLLNLGACEIIFCLFQITICLAVYCNFFNFNKTFRKMHKHLEYQISCRCQQFFFLKNA